MNMKCAICISLAVFIDCHLGQPVQLFAAPQESKSSGAQKITDTPNSESTERYIITVSEYSLKDIDMSTLTEDGILKAIKTQSAVPNETVTLSAVAMIESMVQFKRSFSATRSVTKTNLGTTRQTDLMHTGTNLTVTVSPQNEKVAATIAFTSSRQSGEIADEDSRPKITETMITTTQLLDLSKPTLIGASTAEETSFVFLTVSLR
jgi:hypothetical protein